MHAFKRETIGFLLILKKSKLNYKKAIDRSTVKG